jgi:3-dehydroquinate dehydratase II
MHIAVINGPNLRVVGHRAYGPETLEDIETLMEARAGELGVTLSFAQSDCEGRLIAAIEAAREADAIIVNASAYAHTSLAIADALAATGIPAVEVHLTNIYAREPMRHRSLIAPIAWGQIVGFGYRGYLAALDLLHARLQEAGDDPRTAGAGGAV